MCFDRAIDCDHGNSVMWRTIYNFIKWDSTAEKEASYVDIFKYHVFAPMGRFQLELIYLYFPPSFHLTVVVSVL